MNTQRPSRGLPVDENGRYSWHTYRWIIEQFGLAKEEFCGLPVPLPGEQIVVEESHPLREPIMEINKLMNPNPKYPEDPDDKNWRLANRFYSYRDRCFIYIFHHIDFENNRKLMWCREPAIHHIAQDLSTMACHQAWSIDAELKAMETLRTHVTDHQFRQYFLTGIFLERSRRSDVAYIFRKLRPTVALRRVPKKNNDQIEINTVLCLHPIGYYAGTWAGSMCPTDDVMAHLLMMRGDEKMFWRRANHINPHDPNAGL